MRLCRTCVLLVLAGSCFAIDRNAFTFTHYNLEVRVEPEQQRLAVRGRITLWNDSASQQKNAVLQVSSSLDWRSIQVEGKPVQFVSQRYASDIDHTGAVSEAIVALPTAVPPKSIVEIDVGYEGVIPQDATRLKRIGVPEDVAKHSDWDQISPAFTAVRGVGYVVWYPVSMDAANLSESNRAFDSVDHWKRQEQGAEMKVSLCAIGDDGAATTLMNDLAPLQLAGSSDNAADSTNCSAHSFVPLGLKVPAFVVAPYQTVETASATIFFLSGNDSGAKSYADAIGRVSPLVKDWLGPAHTREKMAQVADPGATPFETGGMLLTPFSADHKLAELSVVHAVAHAAFASPRPWIYEGVAHLMQGLWREHEDGRQAALDFMGLHRTSLAQVEDQKKGSDAASLIVTSEEELYRSKAMFVFWMLRDMVGERSLKKALAAYKASDDRDATYLPKLLQAQSSRNLEWFFEDWVYQDRGLPDFRVASVYASKTEKGIYLVTVTIENLGEAGAEVPFVVRFNGGEVWKRIVVRGKGQATTRVEIPASPTDVIVNDGSVPESSMVNNTFKVAATGTK